MGETVIRYWRVLILCLGLMAIPPLTANAGSAQLFAVQLTASTTKTQVVIGLGRPTPFHASAAAGDRVTVDFDGLTLIPNGAAIHGLGLIRSYHAEPIQGGVRLVLDLARPAIITTTQALPAETGKPPRAVIELAPGTAQSVQAAAAPAAPPQPVARHIVQNDQTDVIGTLIEKPRPIDPAPRPIAVAAPLKQPKPAPEIVQPPEDPSPAVAPAVDVVSPAPAKGGKSIPSIISPKRTIVIDAGHGGIDPGAESVAGYHEKEITLATARLLARTLEQTGRYKVVLTRDSDVYLKLHERVARARAAHGNLFISLHADSAVTDRSTRGASIYTLSETASDVESDKYAQRENRADAIGGVDLGDQSDDVAGILVDLTVRETVNDGNRLAGMMVDALEHKGVSLLPSTPHRSAGFAVLKSPDIPSVLIEMGYLSDMADARALADPRHQQQIANAIADGVDRYFAWLQVSRS